MFYPSSKDVSDFPNFAYKLSTHFPIAEDSTDKLSQTVRSIMTNFKNYRAGSEEQYEPRLLGDILTDMFSSDSPTAKTFLKSVTSHEDTIAKGKATTEDDTTAEWETDSFAGSGRFNNTELSSNVKTFLYFDHIAEIGKVYKGLFRRDSDEHFSFFEYRRSAAKVIIRNPHVFKGKYINVTRRVKDGHVRFNFKEVNFSIRFNPVNFAIGVMKEILKAFIYLGKEVSKTSKHVG